MWKSLSLRQRLLLPLGGMFVAVLLLGGISLQIFAPTQLVDENEPAARATKAVADALASALQTSANPEQTLDAFVHALGTAEAIHFRRTGTPLSADPPVEVRTSLGRVPSWFVELLGVPDVRASFPVTIGGKPVGDMVFSPDISADLYEKWIAFLALVSSGIALMVLTGIIAYFTTGAALEPLRRLGEGLTRMRMGEYDRLIRPSGPPEIRRGAEEANELARTLGQLSRDNRSLLRRIVSLQDDERRDMARELHDELGPLLFGIRANTVALREQIPPDQIGLAPAAEGILHSVEALQLANRRILDRLRPLYIQELGLANSIQTLLQYAKAQAPNLQLNARIDPGLNELDGLLSQTVYRVIQEAVTNVLRHAQACSISVTATIEYPDVSVEVSDDGIGFPEERVFGRGLTGMQERVRALSGTLELSREQGCTFVRCRLRAEEAASDTPAAKQA